MSGDVISAGSRELLVRCGISAGSRKYHGLNASQTRRWRWGRRLSSEIPSYEGNGGSTYVVS